jgi:hypothetical protein
MHGMEVSELREFALAVITLINYFNLILAKISLYFDSLDNTH